MKRMSFGFALLEALIGVSIMGVAILGISMLQAKLVQADTLASQRFEASIIAQRKMEELRNFSSIIAYDAIANGNDTASGKSASYTRTWTVVTSTSPAYKTVTVTVTWASNEGTAETFALTSTIAACDPYYIGRLISVYAPLTP